MPSDDHGNPRLVGHQSAMAKHLLRESWLEWAAQWPQIAQGGRRLPKELEPTLPELSKFMHQKFRGFERGTPRTSVLRPERALIGRDSGAPPAGGTICLPCLSRSCPNRRVTVMLTRTWPCTVAAAQPPR
jgi:hypothetical protein